MRFNELIAPDAMPHCSMPDNFNQKRYKTNNPIFLNEANQGWASKWL